MKKTPHLLLGLSVSLIASFSFASSVSAATTSVITYQSGSPSIHTTGSLFDIPNLNPGDHYSTTITFDNQTAEDLSLTLKDIGQTFDRSGLTGLTFTLRDSSGKIIAQSDNLYDLFDQALGLISGYSTRTFTLELSVSPHLKNAYQGVVNTHYINFAVQADSSSHKAPSTHPNTGFGSHLLGDYVDPLGLFLAASLMAIICSLFFLLNRRHHAED